MDASSLLSPELLASMGADSYGTAPTDILLSANTTQKQREKEDRKRKRDAQPDEEVKQVVKKLSKKQQKRVEQIQKRKERELKAGDYLQTIKQNAISASDQQLMTSSKRLNHTMSMKQTLALLIKKEKAGIKLTEDEMNILYVKKDGKPKDWSEEVEDPFFGTYSTTEDNRFRMEPEDDDVNKVNDEQEEEFTKKGKKKNKKNKSKQVQEDDDDSNKMEVEEKAAPTAVAQTTEEPSSTLFSFNDLFAAKPKPVGDAGVINTEKKKKRKKIKGSQEDGDDNEEGENNKADVAPALIKPAEPTKVEKLQDNDKPKEKKQPLAKNIGSNLLSQLMNLKGKKTEKKEEEVIEEVEDEQVEEKEEVPGYKIEETIMPVDDLGVIQHDRTANGSDGNSQDLSTIKPNRHIISVNRPQKVIQDRINLPVCRMEQEIVEAVTEHDVIILCGETGSGKSTQVPQFLYESGYGEYGYIGIAQPRRVAVTSTANRVNYEMGEIDENGNEIYIGSKGAKLAAKKKKKAKLAKKAKKLGLTIEDDNDDEEEEDINKIGNQGRLVGYQIRYDSTTVGKRTKIKFMTDGILLREVTSDILLRQYSVIILDEAHERNVNTDILLGMLSRTLPLRQRIAKEEMTKWQSLSEEERLHYAPPLKPLKLIIMSATIRVQDFQTPVLFPRPPPLIQVEARQYPVVPHFAKRTELQNYLKETHRKTCQIHRRLPAGGILVFLTGKREILYMCSKLQQSLRVKKGKSGMRGSKDGDTSAGIVTSTGESGEGAGEGGEEEPEEDFTGIEEYEDGDDYKKYSSMGDQDQAEIDSDDDFDSDLDENDSDEGYSDDENFAREALGLPMIENSRGDDKKESDKDEKDDSKEEDDEEKVRSRMLAEILGLGKPVEEETVEKDTEKKDNKSEEEVDKLIESTEGQDPLTSATIAAANTGELPEMPELKPLIRPLYAMMPAHLQARVFAPVPPGYRLIVVATNVAETSITIPGITYVVDCGRCKEKVMSSGTSGSGAGIAKYEITWISKASADQRQGRAGRTGPGHCYRLYSSNFYHEHMRTFLPPEITATPLEDVILQMKALGIKEIESFPFPTMPPRSSLLSALGLLTNLGAIVPNTVTALDEDEEGTTTGKQSITTSMNAFSKLDEKMNKLLGGNEIGRSSVDAGGKLSDIGKLMAKFPLHPRFAKMIIIAARYTNIPMSQIPQFMGYVLTLVATMAEKSVFMLDEAISQKNSEAVVTNEENDNSDGDGDSDRYNSLEDSDHDRRGGKGGDSDDDDNGSSGHYKKQKPKKQHKSPGFKGVMGTLQLFNHSYGDAMARLQATGAFTYQVVTECQRLRLERREQRQLERMKAIEDGRMEIEEDSSDHDDDNDENKSFSRKELQAVTTMESINTLCNMNYLHLPSLQRVLDLRMQLQTICHSLFPLLFEQTNQQQQQQSIDFNPPLSPPSSQEEIALRQILLSGYCDSIARKAPIGMIKEGSRRQRLTAYYSCNPTVKEPLYIHPQSNLYHSDPTAILPEFIIYSSLLRNQKGNLLYMTNCTVINANWISGIARDCPLLTWSDPLSSPPPSYDMEVEKVMCYVVPKFGIQAWSLPAVKRPMEECVKAALMSDNKHTGLVPTGHRAEDEIYRWFARFLLEGAIGLRVSGALVKERYTEPTTVFTQNKLHPKVTAILRQLVKHKITSKPALLNYLKSNPNFLSEEIQGLLKVEYRKAFRLAWSQLSR